jgi:phosphohistidine phosphatase
MKPAAAGIAALVRPEHVLTSPLVRARQTAAIVAEAFGNVPVTETDALAEGDHDALLAAAQATGKEVIAAVGHEPWLSEAAAYFLTGSAGGASLRFKKGAAALVVFPGAIAPGHGALEWLIQPAGLRAIGRSGS